MFLLLFSALTGSDIINLGSVVVEEGSLTRGVNEFGQSSTVFSGSAVEASAASNVADILERVSGIYIEKAGALNFTAGSSGTSVLKIRGIGSLPNSGILAVVDDRPLFMGLFKHPMFDMLPLDYAERVEVIKGPSGVLFGNQAVGGVIHISSKRPEPGKMKTVLSSAMGNYYTQDHYINNMAEFGGFDYMVSAGYKGTEGPRRNSDSYQQNYMIKAGYDFEGLFRLSGSGQYSEVTFYNPGPVNENWHREQEGAKMIQRSGDITIERKEDDCVSKIIVYADTGANKFLKQKPGPVLIPGSYNVFNNYGARAMREWRLLPGNLIKAGFDWQYFDGGFENYPPNPAMKIKEKRSENDYAPYLMASRQIGALSLSLGARYGINTLWGPELIPQAGVKVSVYEGNTVFVNASKGYKTPAMGQVIFEDYDELVPENFWQYEAGVTHEIKGLLYAGASVYQTEGNNLLMEDPVDSKYKNSGFVLIRGVEAEFDVNVLDMFNAGASCAYMDPREKTEGNAFFTGGASVSTKALAGIKFKIEGRFAKERFDTDHRKNRLDDYHILNASAGYDAEILGTDTSFFLEVKNMLDNKYEVKKYYPAPGFLIRGGMTIRI